MTVETEMYSPGWKTCSRCKLTAPDMVGTPPRCAMRARCDAVLKGASLGSPLELRGPLVRVELDPAEQAQVVAAVEAWRARQAPPEPTNGVHVHVFTAPAEVA